VFFHSRRNTLAGEVGMRCHTSRVTCNPFRPLLSVLLVEPVVSSGNTAFGLCGADLLLKEKAK